MISKNSLTQKLAVTSSVVDLICFLDKRLVGHPEAVEEPFPYPENFILAEVAAPRPQPHTQFPHGLHTLSVKIRFSLTVYVL